MGPGYLSLVYDYIPVFMIFPATFPIPLQASAFSFAMQIARMTKIKIVTFISQVNSIYLRSGKRVPPFNGKHTGSTLLQYDYISTGKTGQGTVERFSCSRGAAEVRVSKTLFSGSSSESSPTEA